MEESAKQVTKKKISFWKLLRNLVIGVAAVFCIITMGSQDSSGGLQERYFVGLYRIDDTDYYTNSNRFLMRWYWYELWQDEDGDDTRIHRFPEGTIPTWSEEHQAFFYRKGRSIYRWDMETDKAAIVYTMEAPSLWDGIQDFFLNRSHSLQAVMKDYLLLRRSDGLYILVDLKTNEVTNLENGKGYYSEIALDDYLIFYGYEKPWYVISLESGEAVQSLPFENFSVDVLDTKGNQVLLKVDISQDQECIFWYDADLKDLRKLFPQEPSEYAESILKAQFAWEDVVCQVKLKGDHTKKIYQVDTNGIILSQWELPKCDEIKAFEVTEDYLICVGAEQTGQMHSPHQLLTYYQVTRDGEIKKVYEWSDVSSHALNTCHVIIDGDLVISGCPAEAEKIRFTVDLR